MKKWNCLIVDDEPIAVEIVASYCQQLDYLNVVGCCNNALDAKKLLQEQPIDIIFLDINMPVLSGLSFVKTLKEVPQIIFTTAYKEYAVDAFDLSACDYLLKPFSFERFMIAVDKAVARLEATRAPIKEINTQPVPDFVFLRVEGKIHKVTFHELIYAEAQGNYTKVVTAATTLLPVMTFNALISLLPPDLFLRTHRSFLINKSKITHIDGNRVFADRTEIPIGSNYRESFLKSLGL